MRLLPLLFLLLPACDAGPEVPTAADNPDLDSAADMLNRAETDLAPVDGNELVQSDADRR